MNLGESFARFAKATARHAGHPATFSLAVLVILAWAVTGPIFQFNDTWQLTINTGTTIITFLMVFLIQNTQNRDGVAMQVKLDELLRAANGAATAMADMEDLTEEELTAFQEHYRHLAEAARREMRDAKQLPFARKRTEAIKPGEDRAKS